MQVFRVTFSMFYLFTNLLVIFFCHSRLLIMKERFSSTLWAATFGTARLHRWVFNMFTVRDRKTGKKNAQILCIDDQLCCHYMGSYRPNEYVWTEHSLLPCSLGICYRLLPPCAMLVIAQEIPQLPFWQGQYPHDPCWFDTAAWCCKLLLYRGLYHCTGLPMVSTTLASQSICKIQLPRFYGSGFSHFANGLLCRFCIERRRGWYCPQFPHLVGQPSR